MQLTDQLFDPCATWPKQSADAIQPCQAEFPSQTIGLTVAIAWATVASAFLAGQVACSKCDRARRALVRARRLLHFGSSNSNSNNGNNTNDNNNINDNDNDNNIGLSTGTNLTVDAMLRGEAWDENQVSSSR